jgi:hypothetical protein
MNRDTFKEYVHSHGIGHMPLDSWAFAFDVVMGYLTLQKALVNHLPTCRCDDCDEDRLQEVNNKRQ